MVEEQSEINKGILTQLIVFLARDLGEDYTRRLLIELDGEEPEPEAK